METHEEATDPFAIGDMTPAQQARRDQLVKQEAERKAKRATGRAAVTPAGKAALETLEAAGARQAEAIEQATGIEAMVRAGVKLALEELLRRGLAVVPTNERRYELELAEGVEPIDRLQAARREAVGRLAVLEGKYEVWDARRKMHRAGISNELALEIEKEKGKKPSEAELERLAAADPRTVTFLDAAEEWLAELFITRNEVKEYDEIVNRDQAVLRLRARERDL